MPIPILLVAAGLVATVVAIAAKKAAEEEEQERRRREQEIADVAEKKRQQEIALLTKEYCREKLKAFIEKEKLQHSQQNTELDKLINEIESLGDVTINIKMHNLLLESPTIIDLNQKIQKEKTIISQQEEADNYLTSVVNTYAS